MQFLTADEDAQRRDIAGGIRGLVIAVAPVVTHAVDHAGRPERNPCHLHRPQHQAGNTEQHDIEQQQQCDAEMRQSRIDMTLQPVIRRHVAIVLKGAVDARLLPV